MAAACGFVPDPALFAGDDGIECKPTFRGLAVLAFAGRADCSDWLLACALGGAKRSDFEGPGFHLQRPRSGFADGSASRSIGT